jgi:hypothetical protein
VDKAGNICDLASKYDTTCAGLKLVNPGVENVEKGATIQAPPCTLSG